MAYQIKVKYDPAAVTVKAPVDESKLPTIPGTFTTDNCAANMPAFDGTYYDTNTPGEMGAGTLLEDFMAQQITHPGVISAVRKAVRASDGTSVGEYTFETDVPMYDAFLEECGKALASRGISFERL